MQDLQLISPDIEPNDDPEDDQERLGSLNVPILGLFGAKDRGVTSETVNGFESALNALGKNVEIQIFSDAGHAFADPGATTYNAEVAEQAWSLMVDFLNRNLVVNDPVLRVDGSNGTCSTLG